MHFEDLIQFIERDMRMSHVYQPVMLRELLDRGGRASRKDIARALLNEDRSQLDYYSEIAQNMVGRVLTNRNVVKRDGANYELLGYESSHTQQVQELKNACDRKLAEYVARRGDLIWEHRRRSSGYVSGTLRYEVLKARNSVVSFAVSRQTTARWKSTTSFHETKVGRTRSQICKLFATAAMR